MHAAVWLAATSTATATAPEHGAARSAPFVEDSLAPPLPRRQLGHVSVDQLPASSAVFHPPAGCLPEDTPNAFPFGAFFPMGATTGCELLNHPIARQHGGVPVLCNNRAVQFRFGVKSSTGFSWTVPDGFSWQDYIYKICPETCGSDRNYVRGGAGCAQAMPQSQREALVALYDSLGGPGWVNNHGWLDGSKSPCEWHGVVCKKSGSVTSLNLELNHLVGTIPTEIGRFVDFGHTDVRPLEV